MWATRTMNIQSEVMNAHENDSPVRLYISCCIMILPWIVPSGDTASFNEPSELAFTHDSVHKVHSGKGLDAYTTKTQSTLDPEKLGIAIIVFGCTEGCQDFER